jgi:hypothetical protein
MVRDREADMKRPKVADMTDIERMRFGLLQNRRIAQRQLICAPDRPRWLTTRSPPSSGVLR